MTARKCITCNGTGSVPDESDSRASGEERKDGEIRN